MSQTGSAGMASYGAVPHGLRGDGPRAGMRSGSQTSCVTAATCSTVSFLLTVIRSNRCQPCPRKERRVRGRKRNPFSSTRKHWRRSSREWRLSYGRSVRVASQGSTAAQKPPQAQAELEVSSLIWLNTTRHPHSTRSGVKTYGELHLHIVLMTS